MKLHYNNCIKFLQLAARLHHLQHAVKFFPAYCVPAKA